METLFTTEFGLWVDKRSSTDNTIHESCRKSDILLQIEKPAESSNCGLAYHVFCFEDTVGYLPTIDPSGILTIEN